MWTIVAILLIWYYGREALRSYKTWRMNKMAERSLARPEWLDRVKYRPK